MEIVKILHVISGIVIALTGLMQIIFKKGSKFHRVVGITYFLAWPIVVITGWILGSFFIALLGAFGFYMAYTGYRFGRLKSTSINSVDKIVIVSALLMSVFIFLYGLYFLIAKSNNFGIVLLFFGVIFSINSIFDFNGYVRGKLNRKMSGDKMEWFFEHFGRMYISYIAAMTAFTVIQNPFPFFEILNWILPTIIGTLIIIFTSRYYRKKLNIDLK